MYNWKYKTYRLMWLSLDLLFPPQCGGCGRTGSRWCEGCQNNVKILNGTICEICGLPQEAPGICGACLVERPHFRSLRAWAIFENPIQKALHQLKYRRGMALGDALAAAMTDFTRRLDWSADVLAPIPLGQKRMRERGYNQVAMIAKPLALSLGMQYAPRLLTRQKETRSQVGLSREERRENVREAFSADVKIQGKTVLVMDDVSTTGSTLSSAAQALRVAGAKEVYALTVARALPHRDLKRA
ncbi:MAG: ComF family protein [Anaerolineales bacterium]|nr:ComF family protein [Anaerolineales bacterium]